MSTTCSCPRGTSLETIPTFDCPERWGQTQKVIFQRLYDGTDENEIATAEALASWTPLLTATDNTKIVVSPVLAEPTAEPGEMIAYGGGNATPDGIEMDMGTSPTTFSARFLNTPQGDVIKALKDLRCELNLGVYLVNAAGKIAGRKIVTGGGTPVTTWKPFPIQQLFIGDKGLGGLEEPDSNAISWGWPAGWSDDFGIIDTTFNALTALR